LPAHEGRKDACPRFGFSDKRNMRRDRHAQGNSGDPRAVAGIAGGETGRRERAGARKRDRIFPDRAALKPGDAADGLLEEMSRIGSELLPPYESSR
jgi:hypothetical protein